MRDVYGKLREQGVTVFGVSGDPVESLARFVSEKQVPFELLSDEGGKVAEKMGVPVKFGKFLARQAFLFRDGVLVWEDREGETKGQGEDVLKALEVNS